MNGIERRGLTHMSIEYTDPRGPIIDKPCDPCKHAIMCQYRASTLRHVKFMVIISCNPQSYTVVPDFKSGTMIEDCGLSPIGCTSDTSTLDLYRECFADAC